MRIDWHKYIAVNNDVHHGEPCINGTRVPITMIVGSFADGMTFDEILDAYPQLIKESIQAALADSPGLLLKWRNRYQVSAIENLEPKLGPAYALLSNNLVQAFDQLR